MTSPLPTRLLWCDLETTHNDPRQGVILEIGAIITDWSPELHEIAAARMLVRPPGNAQDHTTLWYRTPNVIQQMHTDNGLWLEATTSAEAWSIHDADQAFAGWMREYGGDVPMPLAGAGVGHLDLPFILEWMPATAAQLLYWPLDISPHRRMLELAGRDDLVNLERDVHAKPHRALEDIRLHVAEGRHYLRQLQTIPSVEQPELLDRGGVDPRLAQHLR